MTLENWHLFMPPGALFFAGCVAAALVGFLLVMCGYACKGACLKRRAAGYARSEGLPNLSELLKLGVPQLIHNLLEETQKSEKKFEMETYADLLTAAWYAKDSVSAYWDLARWSLYVLGAVLLLILARTAYVFAALKF